jgi:negative regulator of genetic competence, sporulation and motility
MNMKQQCRVCQKIFSYCHSCAITKDLFKNAGYCDEDCYHISLILQAHTVKSITSEEAMNKLREHNIENKQLQQSLQNHYGLILQDTTVIEEVVPQEDVEVVINEDEDMTIS